METLERTDVASLWLSVCAACVPVEACMAFRFDGDSPSGGWVENPYSVPVVAFLSDPAAEVVAVYDPAKRVLYPGRAEDGTTPAGGVDPRGVRLYSRHALRLERAIAGA